MSTTRGKNAGSGAEALSGGKRSEGSGEESGEGKKGSAEKGEGVPNGINNVTMV